MSRLVRPTPRKREPFLPSENPQLWSKLHARLVAHWIPASVLVRAGDLEVLQLSVGAGRFLQLAEGTPTRHLFGLVHPGLRASLRVALADAQRTGRPTTTANVAWAFGGRTKAVTLRVIPGGKLAEGVLLVTFEDAVFGEETPPPARDLVAETLERELEIARDELAELATDRDSSIEGLNQSNAELETVNEELQAALEELESSRLGLESMNLELTSVNHELQRHLEESSRANNDLQNLMAATEIAIVFLDRDLRIMRFTPAAVELFHFIDADIGRPLAHLRHTLAYAELLDDAARAVAEASTTERLIRAGESRYYLARVLPYRINFDRTDGVVLTFIDVTEKQQAQAVVRNERARIDLERRLIQAQEEERGRISRELHDEVGQQLTALILGLKQLEGSRDSDPDRIQKLRGLRAIAKQVGHEIHELALALRPTALDDLGLLGALNNHLESWSSNTGISVDFHAIGLDDARLSTHVETTVYRIAQEALNNIVKHAAAHSVSVTLDSSAERLLAVIEDDGIGFDEGTTDSTAVARLGLAGMRQRVALVGGNLTVESALGKGTTIILRIPTANQPLTQ